jgi:hypothetical protein
MESQKEYEDVYKFSARRFSYDVSHVYAGVGISRMMAKSLVFLFQI